MSESTFDRLTKALPAPEAKKDRKPLYLGAAAVGAALLVGLAAGFGTGSLAPPPEPAVAAGATGFHPLPDLLVNLRPTSAAKLMKLGLTLRTAPARQAELAALEPLLLDGMQDYLRTLDQHDLDGREAMDRFRAELLRRARLLADPVPVDAVLVRTLVLQ